MFSFSWQNFHFLTKKLRFIFSSVNLTKISFFGVKFLEIFNLKKWKKNPLVGSMCFYFWREFLHMTHTKYFYEKKAPKLRDLEEKNSEMIRFRQ